MNIDHRLLQTKKIKFEHDDDWLLQKQSFSVIDASF